MTNLRGVGYLIPTLQASPARVLERKIDNKTTRRRPSNSPIQASELIQQKRKPGAAGLIGIALVLMFILALFWVVMKFPLV